MTLPTLYHETKLFDYDSEEESIDFIITNIPSGIDVGFSGGKDSIVTARLMELSGVEHTLTYSFTGLDPPEVVRFIRKEYPHCQILRKGRTFWKDLAVHSPPSDRLRWCCTLLKKTTTDQVQGIRAEESARRANRPRINTYRGRTLYYPILYWKEWQVWDFIEKHNLSYPSLYDENFDRIGCVVCPYHSEKTGKLHKLYRDKWPRFFTRFEKGITELYSKRVGQGKKMAHGTPEEFLAAWYLDDSSRWYLDENERKQRKLF